MKKTFVYLSTFLVVLICSFSAQAQYAKGDLLINPGISFGGYYSGYVGSYTGIPGLSANIEYNVTDNIAVGGYLGFATRNYAKSYGYKWTSFGFGGRGVFHATEVLNDAFNGSMNSEKLDIYGGLSLGYETFSYSGDNSSYWSGYSTGGVVLGGILGCRYMFNPAIGVFGEVGRGAFGALTLGVSFKL
ncbi:hypothetical protein QNI16_03010 [Cytophagaceae bacterium YF14B1]|uniref:Outer membrane protein beta-barrel domain-containing protein n=1 Tax=Xanthocytophaga flava TaxID=3048013 RepID=A0AAE3QMN0_9BACT|nr:outer membrane beta-barrel protein [Xanthocytophaga flavus]MDJ1479438.1 hypothetical protein [Xanthocytophaga flavus]